jgi:hypothetical protein
MRFPPDRNASPETSTRHRASASYFEGLQSNDVTELRVRLSAIMLAALAEQ